MSYEISASKIAPEIKEEITRAAIEMGGKLHPNESDVRYLFKMFDEHITPYPERNLFCNDCRAMVRNFWQRIVNESTIWKE